MIQGRWLFRGLIALVTCVAAWLRLDDLGGPSLWLDEILNVGIIRSLENPGIVGWVIGFERENGPLYYAFHALAMKLPLGIETAFRLPSAILGIAAVPAIAYAASRVGSSRSAALFAAVLLTFSPLHVFYSREGRPYAALVLASIGVLIALTGRAGRFRPLMIALSLFAAASSALTAAPLILATVVILLIDFMHSREDRRSRSIALAGAIAAALYLLFYLRFPRPAGTLGFDERFASLGAIILNAFSVTSSVTATLTPASICAAFLAVLGFAAMRDRRAAHITLALAILPVVIALLGLIVTDHWFSVRYVIHGLVPFLILAACGIAAVARAIGDLLSRILPVVGARASVAAAVTGLAFTSAFAFTAFPAARSEPLSRADWRGIASTLAARAHDEDVVLTAGEWSAVSLRFYLAELGRPLDVRPVLGDVELARSTVGRRIGGWIVLGGWEDDGALREWACTLFTLAHDRREEVRLAWAPGIASFLQHRATPEDLQHFSATVQSRGGGIALGPGRELLMGEGWHDPGGPDSGWFRWVRRELSLLAPLPQGRSRLELDVIANPGPKLPQRMSVLMNGEVIARHELSRAMQTYSVDLGSPEASLEEIGLLFDWEYSPAEIDGTSDTRKIAAGIGSIAIRPDAAAPLPSVPLPLLFNVGPPRLTTPPTDEVCEGEIPWTRAGEEKMQLRLGYGSNVTLDASRASFAAAFVEALPPRECLSDRSFVTHVFALLLERYPDKVGETTYLAGLAHGWSRENVVCRVSRAEEFMRIYAEEGAGE